MQSMYSLWVDYNDRSFFRPDSSSFRRQVLFCWSCGHLKSDIAFLAGHGLSGQTQTRWTSFRRMRDRNGKSDRCSGTTNTIGRKHVDELLIFCFCFFSKGLPLFLKLDATNFYKRPSNIAATRKRVYCMLLDIWFKPKTWPVFLSNTNPCKCKVQWAFVLREHVAMM